MILLNYDITTWLDVLDKICSFRVCILEDQSCIIFTGGGTPFLYAFLNLEEMVHPVSSHVRVISGLSLLWIFRGVRRRVYDKLFVIEVVEAIDSARMDVLAVGWG